jgi:hypothetical protein
MHNQAVKSIRTLHKVAMNKYNVLENLINGHSFGAISIHMDKVGADTTGMVLFCITDKNGTALNRTYINLKNPAEFTQEDMQKPYFLQFRHNLLKEALAALDVCIDDVKRLIEQVKEAA